MHKCCKKLGGDFKAWKVTPRQTVMLIVEAEDKIICSYYM